MTITLHRRVALLIACIALPAFSQDRAALEQRIQRVENGLLPAEIGKGESTPKWTVPERMAHYNVVGVSVAVIDNYAIHWAKGYGVLDKDTRQATRGASVRRAIPTGRVRGQVSCFRVANQPSTIGLLGFQPRSLMVLVR